MSKEKTPITAKEWYKENRWRFESDHWYEIMEQYAQAKVLEALEREFSEVAVDWGQLSMMNGTKYYETEVKPKYEN